MLSFIVYRNTGEHVIVFALRYILHAMYDVKFGIEEETFSNSPMLDITLPQRVECSC